MGGEVDGLAGWLLQGGADLPLQQVHVGAVVRPDDAGVGGGQAALFAQVVGDPPVAFEWRLF
ncbi:hypothetical protein GCM10010293_49880 [Streptomyces griseoflavus]|nr:hypothetical protein GCM10010293_49880 [Streptomyces griseoflavus]